MYDPCPASDLYNEIVGAEREAERIAEATKPRARKPEKIEQKESKRLDSNKVKRTDPKNARKDTKPQRTDRGLASTTASGGAVEISSGQ